MRQLSNRPEWCIATSSHCGITLRLQPRNSGTSVCTASSWPGHHEVGEHDGRFDDRPAVDRVGGLDEALVVQVRLDAVDKAPAARTRTPRGSSSCGRPAWPPARRGRNGRRCARSSSPRRGAGSARGRSRSRRAPGSTCRTGRSARTARPSSRPQGPAAVRWQRSSAHRADERVGRATAREPDDDGVRGAAREAGDVHGADRRIIGRYWRSMMLVGTDRGSVRAGRRPLCWMARPQPSTGEWAVMDETNVVSLVEREAVSRCRPAAWCVASLDGKPLVGTAEARLLRGRRAGGVVRRHPHPVGLVHAVGRAARRAVAGGRRRSAP